MCMACHAPQFDSARADAFAQKMMGILNSAALALMTSIGHRTGLFDELGSGNAVTSGELADRTGLNERYVREWLGAMTVGQILTYDPETRRHTLPAEHAAFLTRASTPNNIATTTQFVSILGSVEDQIVQAFRAGGGVPYAEYNRFNDVMAEESQQTVVSGLAEHILPLIPGLTDKLTAGIDVLDVGCGVGRALVEMALMYPHSRFTGYDFQPEAVAAGRRIAAERGATNVAFDVRDVTTLDGSQQFDFVTTFDVIHDQANPSGALASIRRSLKPDGVYLMQDIKASSVLEKNMDHPIGPFLYTISCMHCMTVSLAQGGAGLGTVWGEELALKMLADAGLKAVKVEQLPHDIINSYYVAYPQ